MGLPCAHEFADRAGAGGALQPRDLHPYWLLRLNEPLKQQAVDPLLLVRDPPVGKEKGRPKGALGGSRTTKRDPSLFEVAEAAQGASPPRATPSD